MTQRCATCVTDDDVYGQTQGLKGRCAPGRKILAYGQAKSPKNDFFFHIIREISLESSLLISFNSFLTGFSVEFVFLNTP